MTDPRSPLYSPLVEQALRTAAQCHQADVRKGTGTPYITHPAAVAMILIQAGFDDEHTLAAALLHDVVEDTDCTLEHLASTFPSTVVDYVADLSEQKLDEHGEKRSWQIRKNEHIAQLATAPQAVRTIVLADKLHNLATMCDDLQSGPSFWDRFNATPEQILWYNRSIVEQAASDDESLQHLAQECLKYVEKLKQAVASDG